MKKLMCAVFISALLTGCATMNVPGQTSASPRLKSDVAHMINTIESAQAPGCSHKIVDTKFDRMDGDSVYENWIVESCGKELVYQIQLSPDPKGGAYFGVTTPKRDQKK